MAEDNLPNDPHLGRIWT